MICHVWTYCKNLTFAHLLSTATCMNSPPNQTNHFIFFNGFLSDSLKITSCVHTKTLFPSGLVNVVEWSPRRVFGEWLLCNNELTVLLKMFLTYYTLHLHFTRRGNWKIYFLCTLHTRTNPKIELTSISVTKIIVISIYSLQ